MIHPRPSSGALWHHLLPVALLVACVWAVYGPCLGHDFLTNWDDQKYVVANETIRGLTPAHLRQAFTTFYVGNYAPVQILSYMLDYTLWGMRPAGYIAVDILLHCGVGILLYLLVLRLEACRFAALLAAAIFLLHPVQVEAVAWISQRKTLLAAFFFLLALHAWLGANEAEGARGRRLYLASLAAFILALLAKVSAIVLPAVLLLHTLCYPREGRTRSFRAIVPFVVVAVPAAWLAVASQAPDAGGGRVGFHGGSPLATFLTMIPVLADYLRLLVWPQDLSALYEPTLRTGLDGTVLLCAGLLLLIGAAGVLLWHRSRRHLFWYGLFFLGLGPVMQVVPLVTLMNDRYLYLPLLGAAPLAAVAVAVVRERGKGGVHRLLTAVMFVVLVVLALLARDRTTVWRSSLSLWDDTVRKVPGSVQAWFGLGDAYGEAGRGGEAMNAYRRALAINPYHADTLQNLGISYLQGGDAAAAKPLLHRLVRLRPGSSEAFFLLGNCHFQAGEWSEAERAYERALSLDPRSGDALLNLGKLYAREGKPVAAREAFQGALRTETDRGDVYYNLATLEASQFRPDAALDYLERAFRKGFRDFADLPRNRGLDPLRGLPAFRRLAETYVPPLYR